MFSMAPNIVLAPNMTQNAERKHRTQDTNTANFRSSFKYLLFLNCRQKAVDTLALTTANVNLLFKNTNIVSMFAT